MAKRIIIIDESVRDKILDFANLLKKSGVRVEKIILYGSYAKGKGRQGSDIDLCVVSAKFDKRKDSYFKKIWHLAAKVDSALEPIPFTQEELTNKYSTLSQEINKHGLRIV